MNLFGLLVLLIVAALCGSIGSTLAGYTTRGCLMKVIVGLIGALIGTWISRELNIPDFLYLARIPIFWSIIGSTIFVALISAFSDRKTTRRR
jgi:uncharacterized membrane protein YeaQ/YmgE (transglycosylase-associated protein family)